MPIAIYLFSQILRFTKNSKKNIENLSRRHFINSFNVFNISGLTVCTFIISQFKSDKSSFKIVFKIGFINDAHPYFEVNKSLTKFTKIKLDETRRKNVEAGN